MNCWTNLPINKLYSTNLCSVNVKFMCWIVYIFRISSILSCVLWLKRWLSVQLRLLRWKKFKDADRIGNAASCSNPVRSPAEWQRQRSNLLRLHFDRRRCPTGHCPATNSPGHPLRRRARDLWLYKLVSSSRLTEYISRWPVTVATTYDAATAYTSGTHTHTHGPLSTSINSFVADANSFRSPVSWLLQIILHLTTLSTRKYCAVVAIILWKLSPIKAKFHYAMWFEAASKLVADLQRAQIWPII